MVAFNIVVFKAFVEVVSYNLVFRGCGFRNHSLVKYFWEVWYRRIF